jgi:hypothetical protein
MITVTEQKPWEEIARSLEGSDSVFLIGCGSCATMLHTGGKTELLEMKDKLESEGKQVSGWMVIPTACDSLTEVAVRESVDEIDAADSILVMTCAFGAQTIADHASKTVHPGLNTLFIGRESDGQITQLCMQCGSCVLDVTGGICPVVSCAKGLMNGPCGGSVAGICEISPEVPCAWQLVIDRMTELGRLEELVEIQPVRDWSASLAGGPRRIDI